MKEVVVMIDRQKCLHIFGILTHNDERVVDTEPAVFLLISRHS